MSYNQNFHICQLSFDEKAHQRPQKKRISERQIVLWSEQSIQILKNFYKQYGPSWLSLSLLINKPQISIKNKFNCQIRKTARQLRDYQHKNLGRPRAMTFSIVNSILSFVNQLQKFLDESDLLINQQSSLFRTKSMLLDYTFSKTRPSLEQTDQLLKMVKAASYKLRSFGIFKVKGIKTQWKFSKNTLQGVLNFDNVIVQKKVKSEQMQRDLVKVQSKIQEKEIKNNIIVKNTWDQCKTQPQELYPYRQLIQIKKEQQLQQLQVQWQVYSTIFKNQFQY